MTLSHVWPMTAAIDGNGHLTIAGHDGHPVQPGEAEVDQAVVTGVQPDADFLFGRTPQAVLLLDDDAGKVVFVNGQQADPLIDRIDQ